MASKWRAINKYVSYNTCMIYYSYLCVCVCVCRCGEVEVREDGSLVITNATATAAGIYICRLSNQYTTVDAMATVIITGLRLYNTPF